MGATGEKIVETTKLVVLVGLGKRYQEETYRLMNYQKTGNLRENTEQKRCKQNDDNLGLMGLVFRVNTVRCF